MFDCYFDFLQNVSNLFISENGNLCFSTTLFVIYIAIFFIVLTYFTLKNLKKIFIVDKYLKLTFINFIKEFILSFFSNGDIYERDYSTGIFTMFVAIVFSAFAALLSVFIVPLLIVMSTFIIFSFVICLILYFPFIYWHKKKRNEIIV